MIRPLLPIYQRKSPQTLEIYRYSIHILRLRDRVTLANARSPPHTPKLLHMVLETMRTAHPLTAPKSRKSSSTALFNVSDPERIVFVRLCFSGFNQTAPIANMAILRRALADADYRGSSVLVALEDSTIVVGLRKILLNHFRRLCQRSCQGGRITVNARLSTVYWLGYPIHVQRGMCWWIPAVHGL